MKPAQWLLIAAIALLPATVLLGSALEAADNSFVVIANRGTAPATVSVRTTNGKQFSWRGQLGPDTRIVRIARFSDNSFVVGCQDASGRNTAEGGYVTSGWSQRIDVAVDGCPAISIDVETLP